jgi:hypothetical protein
MEVFNLFKKKPETNIDIKPVIVSAFETTLMETESENVQELLSDLKNDEFMEVYPELTREVGILWYIRYKAGRIGYIEKEFYEAITKEYGSRNNPKVVNYTVSKNNEGKYICQVSIEVTVFK